MAESESPEAPERGSRFWKPGRRKYTIGLAVLIVILLVHEVLKPVTTGERVFQVSLKLGLVALLGFFAFFYSPNPLTLKKLRRFRSIRRGYYSFLIFTFLFTITFWDVGEYFVNSRALIVKYEGQFFFPTHGAFHPGTDFGFDYQSETNYRDLQERFREEGEGNWVLMPLVPFNPYENDFQEGVFGAQPPDWERKHFLGTDTTSRDILARLFFGFRYAITFAVLVMISVFVIGILVGCAMGYFGGWFDLAVQRLIEIWSNIPFLYVVIIIASIVRPSLGILLGIYVFFSWMGMTYYMRTESYREKARDYVAAARTLGASTPRIIGLHILPNIVATIVTFMPFTVASAISGLTALDFLNFGLPVPTPSWGEMLKKGVENLNSPWIVLAAFGGLVVVLVLITFIGEAIREAFDPKKFTYYR